MSKKRRITLAQVEGQSFYKLYKFLWLDEFKGLDTDAKVLYCMLRDRFELSKANGWVNEYGEVFLIYTREEMAEMIGKSVSKATKCMKLLKQCNLVDEQQQGLNKPNLIFLMDVILGNERTRKNEESRIAKMEIQGSRKLRPNDTDNNETESRETKNLHLSGERRAYFRFEDMWEQDLVRQVNECLGTGRRKISEEQYWNARDILESMDVEDINERMNEYAQLEDERSVEYFIHLLENRWT